MEKLAFNLKRYLSFLFVIFCVCFFFHTKKFFMQGTDDSELSTLEYMDFWMRSIYAHASQNTSNAIDNTRLSPPIFVVGTHRNSLSSDTALQNKIVCIRYILLYTVKNGF